MRWVAIVLIAFLAATCGQKGPLTLPEEEAAVTASVPGAALPSPVPEAPQPASGIETTRARFDPAGNPVRSGQQA